MAELSVKIRAKITNILHDARNKETTIYLGWGIGKNEVRIIRPMTDKYVWSEDGSPAKSGSIETGDMIELVMRKLKKKKREER